MGIGRKAGYTKLSYGVLPLVLDKYILLNSGSALGKGVGPLLIAKEEIAMQKIYQIALLPYPAKIQQRICYFLWLFLSKK